MVQPAKETLVDSTMRHLNTLLTLAPADDYVLGVTADPLTGDVIELRFFNASHVIASVVWEYANAIISTMRGIDQGRGEYLSLIILVEDNPDARTI